MLEVGTRLTEQVIRENMHMNFIIFFFKAFPWLVLCIVADRNNMGAYKFIHAYCQV
jgi:hypothetical protein